MANIENIHKIAKNEWKFQISQFLSYINNYSSGESIFHVEFDFIQKIYDFCKKIEKKDQFLDFFFQNRGWPIIFKQEFLKIVVENFKSKLTCALEMFWN